MSDEEHALATEPVAALAAGSEGAGSRSPASGDELALNDMLDAISKQCAAPTGGAAADVVRPEGTDELGKEAATLRGEVKAGKLSFGVLAAVVSIIGEYRPWEADAQSILLRWLRGRNNTELQAAPPAARPRLTHPLRALPLAAGLAADIWAATPSFFGKQPTGTNYDLSVNAEKVDYFVRRCALCPSCHRSV